MVAQFVDLKIVDGDIVYDNGAELLVDGRDSIAQDIRHYIIESNLLILLIANRNPEERKQIINRLVEYLETDVRVIPGSIRIQQPDIKTLYLSMDTVLGELEFEVEQ